MSLEPWQFKGPKSTVGFLALFFMLWPQLMCSKTDERSEMEDLSELWPAKPPFKLDEDYQSPRLFVFASVSWKRFLQPRILCYSPSCTQLWESSIHSFSCCLLMWLFDKAEVYFFSTGSESWLHKSCLVNDVGLQLSRLPEARQRQQHYSLLGLMQIWKEGLCICHLVSNSELLYPLLPLPAEPNFSWSLSIQGQQWEQSSEGKMSRCSPDAKWSGREPGSTLGTGHPRVCWWGVSGHHWKCLRSKNRRPHDKESWPAWWPAVPKSCSYELRGVPAITVVVCEF